MKKETERREKKIANLEHLSDEELKEEILARWNDGYFEGATSTEDMLIEAFKGGFKYKREGF